MRRSVFFFLSVGVCGEGGGGGETDKLEEADADGCRLRTYLRDNDEIISCPTLMTTLLHSSCHLLDLNYSGVFSVPVSHQIGCRR